MSFEPAQPISVITCDKCQGQGCPACDQQGVYALQDDQPIVFNLPGFIDLKARRFQKKLFLIKRLVLLFLVLTIILFAWLKL
ncbi:MAG: hypothetical protein V1810_00850 [Candidatus Beckwithbacteria bacterium]